jgi:hypothetical protein
LVTLVGCSSDPVRPPPDGGPAADSDCPAGFLGDSSKPAAIELLAVRADGTSAKLGPGDDLALILPPQGGRVAFVGARATNLDGCGVQLVGLLRDTSSKQIRTDGRTVNLNRAPDGWGTTGSTTTDVTDVGAISNFSNIPLCTNQWSDRDVFDAPYELEVTLTDRGGRSAVAKMQVTPRCSEPGKELGCRCLCKKGYQLGETCGLDGGVGDGGI